MDDFLWRALAAGVGVAVVAAPLGAFVVWRRMAFFGDTMAHSALLGVAVGLMAGVDPNLGIVAVCAAIALVLVFARSRWTLAGDTVLGILSHGALALGVIAIASLATVRVDLLAYLFGDILAVGARELAWIWGGGAAVLAVLVLIWRPLLALTVHEDLARVEGVPVTLVELLFMVLMAVLIAGAMKVVGVLLTTALLIVPAAAARPFARTPEVMAAAGAAAGAAAVAAGLAGAVALDVPAGPAIVVAALVLFAAGQAASALRRRR